MLDSFKNLNKISFFGWAIILSAVLPLYTPKFIIMSIPFLPGEIIGLILAIYFLVRGVPINNFTKYFFFYTLIIFFSTFYAHLFRDGVFSFSMPLLSLKRILIVLVFYSGFFLIKNERLKVLKKIIFFYSVPFIIHLFYILYNFAFEGVDLRDFWSKDPKINLTLLTSFNLVDGSVSFIGNAGTSVQLGVFCSFLSIIFLSLYTTLKKYKYLIAHILFLFALVFTVSRSGLLSLFIGLTYFIVIDRTNKKYSYSIFLFSGLILLFSFTFEMISQFGLINRLLSAKSLYDTSASLRVYIWKSFILGLINYPLIFLIGIGYNDDVASNIFRFGDQFIPSSFENMFIDSLAFGGIFCLTFLLVTWHSLFKMAQNYPKINNEYYRAIFKGVYAFLPGYFLANFFGNSFQTDFFQSFFLIVIGIIYFDSRTSTNLNKDIK